MSQTSDADRTFDPTPRRREQARAEGRAARSAALLQAVAWLAGLATLRAVAPEIAASLGRSSAAAWSSAPALQVDRTALVETLTRGLTAGLWLLAPILVAIVASIVASGLAQSGWLWLPERAAPDPGRLGPAGAWRRWTDGETWRSTIRDGLQAAAALGVLAWRLSDGLPALMRATVADAAWPARLCFFLLDTTLAVGGAWLALGLLDYVLAWRRHERSLMMTAQELREEAEQEQRARPTRRLPLPRSSTTDATGLAGDSSAARDVGAPAAGPRSRAA